MKRLLIPILILACVIMSGQNFASSANLVWDEVSALRVYNGAHWSPIETVDMFEVDSTQVVPIRQGDLLPLEAAQARIGDLERQLVEANAQLQKVSDEFDTKYGAVPQDGCLQYVTVTGNEVDDNNPASVTVTHYRPTLKCNAENVRAQKAASTQIQFN